ncbi:MAG: M20/M25/M40 family metallo-hydrolase [Caldilineaceae bacterium]|nr:M20/M25/M40 family metallo-hydrolase [Caldilineaceae bacterium]
MISGHTLAHWLSCLVQIPSVTPDQAGPRAGLPGEARLATAVAGWFQAFGGTVYQEEVLPDRPNVYGLWPGREDRWFGIDVHLDTVGVEQMISDPFDGRIAHGRVYGRGAVDTKATLAVVLALLEAAHQGQQRPRANLLVAATIDEETGARGAPAAAAWMRNRRIQLDQMIVAEPTLCAPVYGNRGNCRLEFQVHGRAAHTSQPQLGQNAVTTAARVVVALDEEHRRLQSEETIPESALGRPTLTVSWIHGGNGINVVPDLCRFAVDRRIVAGEQTGDVSRALRELAQAASSLPLSVTVLRETAAALQPPDVELVQQFARWSGEAPTVVHYGTNAWAYGEVAREWVVLGPGSIEQAHGPEEWVTFAELEKLARIYTEWWGMS